MDLDVLKIYAATYVTESYISADNKLQLIDFIKESNKDHILSLLSTGSMSLNENIGMIVETEDMIENMILNEFDFRDLDDLNSSYKKSFDKAMKKTGAGVKKDMKKSIEKANKEFGKSDSKKASDQWNKMKSDREKGTGINKAKNFLDKEEKKSDKNLADMKSRKDDSDKTQKTIKGAAVAALVAAAIAASYMIYKKHFSQAAKACKGQQNKQDCMRKYKNTAVQAQIRALQSSASKCAQTKNPQKCQAHIHQKISKLHSKIK